MKQQMNKVFWFSLWGALIAFCVVVAIITKMSFNDNYSDFNVLGNMQYYYWPLNIGEAEIDAEKFIDDTSTIIEGIFEGGRIYTNKCFLSDVKVTKVIKGDKELENKIIKVYEAVTINQLDFKMLKTLIEEENFDELMNAFDYKEDETYYSLDPVDMYVHGTTMLKESEKYILFLHEKEYPKEQNRENKTPEFIFQDSPFAKLSLNPLPKYDKAAPEYITLEDSLDYEVLTSDSYIAEKFAGVKEKIFNKLNLANQESN